MLHALAVVGTCQTYMIVDRGADFDRWFYPENLTPGTRSSGSVFAGDGTVDDRFAQIIVGFNSSLDVPAGLGPSAYRVTAAKLTLTTASDAAFLYDPTYDPVSSYVDPQTDGDAGRPIELYGAACAAIFNNLDSVPP